MERPIHHVFLAILFFIFLSSSPGGRVSWVSAAANSTTAVDVGVVLDLGTLAGKKDWVSISMAIDDFYNSHTNFSTRIILHPRDSENDTLAAASAALDLLKNVNVQAIIGPITSSQTSFVAELGSQAQVPILSFSATSTSLSSLRTPYFVRVVLNDSAQVGAIAAIVKSYGWREVVPIYEDSEFGTDIIPSLIDAFSSVDAVVPYRSVFPSDASDDLITAELYKLMTMQTRVFVVHMMSKLGSRLFLKAQSLGLMNKGYVWIITDSLTDILETLDATVLDSMEGALGVRPYIEKSTSLTEFSARWRERFFINNPTVTTPLTDPTVFQLWAYDATWALALAAERAGNLNPHFQSSPRGSDNSTDLGRLGVSENGPRLLATLTSTQFHGVSGDFSLVDGQRPSSTYEIVNMVGKGRRVGIWSPNVGLTTELNSNVNGTLRTSIIWPGDSAVVPKGWEIPTNTMRKKLVIGVPVKGGFNQFVNVEKDNRTGQVKVTGYCIDVFNAAMSNLGYAVPYEFEPFGDLNSSYDDMIQQVYLQKYDAVVGDTTITWNRSRFVDFTLPYTESGVSMVVPMEEDKKKNMWIFLKPLTADLWLVSLAFFVLTGLALWAIEHRINSEFSGPLSEQMGIIFYFAFSTLVFAHKERLESNLSRILVVIWVFVVLILTSSYTASLTSLLTVQKLQPTVTDVSQLIHKDFVGYQDGSFVKELLKGLGIKENRLRKYNTSDQYAEALKNGSKNGGVAALFDEIPYLKIFLSHSEYCANYAMVGQTYKTGGFGFVFPRGSPLVQDLSSAILNVTEGEEMTGIEKKWFGDQLTCPSNSNGFTSGSLSFQNFGGLFLITGVVTLLSLLFFLSKFLYKEWDALMAATTQTSSLRSIVAWYRHYDGKDYKLDDGSKRNETATEVVALPSGFRGSQYAFSAISRFFADIKFGETREEVMTHVSELDEPVNLGGERTEISIQMSE